jgi:hypothetical protein
LTADDVVAAGAVHDQHLLAGVHRVVHELERLFLLLLLGHRDASCASAAATGVVQDVTAR